MLARRPGRKRLVRVALLTVLLSLLSFLIWFHFASSLFLVKVTGRSMEPTLGYGKYYIASKNRDVHRGDIVVFDKGGATYVKRVYATEGDLLYLASEFMDDGSLIWVIIRQADGVDEETMRRVAEKVFTVPPGYLWVEGDNTGTSQGSGQFGLVPVQDVRGTIDES